MDKFTEISAAAIVLEVMAELHLVLQSRTLTEHVGLSQSDSMPAYLPFLSPSLYLLDD